MRKAVLGLFLGLTCLPLTALGQAAPASEAPAEARVVEVGQQIVHPNGTVVRVERVSLFDTYTEVDLLIQNGSAQEVKLSERQGKTFIEADGKDEAYPVAAPPDNPLITVPPGEALQGTLAFVGGLPKNVRLIKIVFNDNGSSSSSSTDVPEFVFEVRPQNQTLLTTDVKKKHG